MLPKEREKATFSTTKMTHILDGGPKKTARRKFIQSPVETDYNPNRWDKPRLELMRDHAAEFLQIHKEWAAKDF